MASLTLDNVSKSFVGGVHAVRGLSLDVADGEFIVLVGPSGCGKTTTLRMIAGLEALTGGEIRIGDRIVNDIQPRDRDVAMVFQNHALYPHMSARQNMGFALKMQKTPRAEIDRRITHTAAMLGIADLLERKPGALSGGQQQRVALGRALVREPAALLLDEPLSNLDASLRTMMRAEIKTVQRRTGTTTIHVTHDQEEAMTLGDRIVVMCGGVAQQVGAPMEVYHRPANQFVATFIGQPAMNMIDGRIKRNGDAATFVTDTGSTGIPLNAELTSAINGRTDHAMTLGLRPTAFKGFATSHEAVSPALDVIVRIIEPLGDQVNIICDFGDQPLLMRLNADDAIPQPGPARVAINTSKVLLFKAGTFGKLVIGRE